MIRLLSHIYPITKKVSSKFNDTLEITWYNGKKYLNSKNANYSFGELQKILKFGLEKIELKNVNTILLLGLGGGSVIETLRNDLNYEKHITAVEIDSIVIDIAKIEFGLKANENLSIICDDALTYVNKNTEKFDLIIIDLFIDNQVPKQFLTLNFWNDIIKINSNNGAIIFNASLIKPKKDALLEIIKILKQHSYRVEVHKKVNNTNTMLITHRI